MNVFFEHIFVQEDGLLLGVGGWDEPPVDEEQLDQILAYGPQQGVFLFWSSCHVQRGSLCLIG